MRDIPLSERFPDLDPGKRPGALGSVNGFGTTLMGSRDADPETGTYVITHVVTALFVPLFALAAYRVAQAQHGGWFCLGRVPLSRFARTCNVLVLLAAVAGAGAIWWAVHVRSDGYIAGKKLDDADAAAAAGEAGRAAKLYREVMDTPTAHAEPAAQKLAGLIESPTGAPKEAAAVFAVAVELHRANRCPVPDLFEKGKAVAARIAPADGAAALAVLETVAPFAPDPGAELDFRTTLLEKLQAAAPADPDAATRLAAAYEARGLVDKCEKLLAPFEKTLGDRDGAALLGRIHLARGRADKAHALLAPYVAARLPALQSAQESYPAQMQAAHGRVMGELRGGKAAGFDYAAYDRAGKDVQAAMVDDYVTARMQADATFQAAQKALAAQRPVIGAVLDLGVLQLQRGQALADPAARAAELQAAEKTFLSVRAVAGESDAYRLSLGQVYHWLGRPADGKKQFDELIAARGNTPEAMLMVATAVREVGDHGGARQLAERAYAAAANDADRHKAAGSRAAMHAGLDDELEWLAKCDGSAPDIQASLAVARGHKAERDGQPEAAADQFRRALDIYGRMTENPATLNNSALAHFALFGATNDRAELSRGTDKMDRAVALAPSNTVLLSNAASMLLQSAVGDAAGAAVDFRALKSPPGGDVLGYLFRTPAERAAVAAKLAAHPGLVKARSYAEKLVVLAPRRDDSFQLLAMVAEYARDDAAVRAAGDRAAKADLDLGEDTRDYKDFLSGASDAKKLDGVRGAVTRSAATLAPARTAGGATFGVAVGRYVRAKTAAWAVGEPADPDELVKLADEAHALAPSAGTQGALDTALQFRAHLTLAKADPAGYGAAAKRTHRSFGTALVPFVLAADGPHAATVAANPDVKRLATLVLEGFDRNPDDADAFDWARVRAVEPGRAAAVAGKAKANPRRAPRLALAVAISPYHANTALGRYYDLLMNAKPADAAKVIADLAATGVAVP